MEKELVRKEIMQLSETIVKGIKEIRHTPTLNINLERKIVKFGYENDIYRGDGILVTIYEHNISYNHNGFEIHEREAIKEIQKVLQNLSLEEVR